MHLWEQRTAEGIILSLVTLNFAIHSEDLSKSKFGQHFQNTKYCSMFVSDSKFECYARGLISLFIQLLQIHWFPWQPKVGVVQQTARTSTTGSFGRGYSAWKLPLTTSCGDEFLHGSNRSLGGGPVLVASPFLRVFLVMRDGSCSNQQLSAKCLKTRFGTHPQKKHE